jgi:copper homeostasis protein CutC
MYHLDGAGALSHLDTLLQIPRLRAIQWVPGAGHERVSQWYDVIRRVLAAGKSVEVFARLEEIDELVREVGPRGLLIHTGGVTPDQAAQLLERYPQDR